MESSCSLAGNSPPLKNSIWLFERFRPSRFPSIATPSTSVIWLWLSARYSRLTSVSSPSILLMRFWIVGEIHDLGTGLLALKTPPDSIFVLYYDKALPRLRNYKWMDLMPRIRSILNNTWCTFHPRRNSRRSGCPEKYELLAPSIFSGWIPFQ